MCGKNMNTEENEIFIQVNNIGFTFFFDRRMKHNLVSPAFLAFFNFGKGRTFLSSENSAKEVTAKSIVDNLHPFYPNYVDSIRCNNVFHYMGQKVGRCSDNKLRVCKMYRLGFEYEGYSFSFPFLLDRSLDKPAILGREALTLMMNHNPIK